MIDVEEAKKVKSDVHPCAECGGEMVYDPATKGLKCPYCESTHELESGNAIIKEYKLDEFEELASRDWGIEQRAIKCESCGAATNIATDAKAVACPFCGSSHIVEDSQSEDLIKPETLIPFSVSIDKAKKAFKEWIGGRWFAPNALKSDSMSKKLQGVYVPFWTYDTESSSDYVAERGDYYYVTVEYTNDDGETETKEEQRTRWTTVSGRYNCDFDDILIPASDKMNKDILAATESFNLKNLTEYSPKYLSGFLAQRYNINLQKGFEDAKEKVDDTIVDGIRNQVGGDRFRLTRKHTHFDNVLFKHLLLPLWMSTYMFNGKQYQYIINGENGEVSGEYPLSFWKVTFLILTIAAAVGAFFYFKNN